jgi:hypothetical protein
MASFRMIATLFTETGRRSIALYKEKSPVSTDPRQVNERPLLSNRLSNRLMSWRQRSGRPSTSREPLILLTFSLMHCYFFRLFKPGIGWPMDLWVSRGLWFQTNSRRSVFSNWGTAGSQEPMGSLGVGPGGPVLRNHVCEHEELNTF